MKTTARIGISLTSAYLITIVLLYYLAATIGDMIRATVSTLVFSGLALLIYKLIR